jgi:hypothetical protein
MTGVGEAVQAAAISALTTIRGIGRVYDAPPIQAAFPHALVVVDAEFDWGHKSGAGREVRLAATIFDKGERPVRLRQLASEAEGVLAGIDTTLTPWRLVTIIFVRRRIVATRPGNWAAVSEYRARLLRGD